MKLRFASTECHISFGGVHMGASLRFPLMVVALISTFLMRNVERLM